MKTRRRSRPPSVHQADDQKLKELTAPGSVRASSSVSSSAFETTKANRKRLGITRHAVRRVEDD